MTWPVWFKVCALVVALTSFAADLSAQLVTRVPTGHWQGAVAPVIADGPLLGHTWSDTSSTPVLRICTAVDATICTAWTAVGGGAGVPAGLITFTAGACPTGWSEYTAARGFAVVGLPSGGAAAGTVGTAFTDQQDKSASLTHSGTAVDNHASHSHTYTDIVNHTHLQRSQTATTGSVSSWEHGVLDTSSTAAETLATDNPVGGVATGTTAGPSATLTHAVTQPSAHTILTSQVLGYIQLRACQKD